jgi:S-methylmethionine-dependent homocysteine/selenocysteine methylase
MSKYRKELPQLTNRVFLTDSGLETTLIFKDGIELNQFASFELMKNESGRRRLSDYFRQHAQTAVDAGMGFVLESATWRSNADWGAKLGYSPDQLADLNRQSIELLVEVRDELETKDSPMPISGNVGPLGDGYAASTMSADDAERLHMPQIKTFSQTDADLVSAFTMTSTEEAIGVTRAALKVKMPVVISFTVETDGRLPTGQTLKEAIETVEAATDAAPAYYMINCAHPTHFQRALAANEAWIQRVRGIRANASKRSHAELDEAKDLDDGDPAELGRQYRDLRRTFRQFNVLGGCCGTDHRHVEQICFACSDAGV